jgi:lia operon protein LiaG
LSYVLKDSVLTIHLQRKDQKFSGISVLSETSKIEFYVPENVDVKMDSDLGDIDVDGLKNTGTLLYSALGDITATNSTGRIDVETSLGDISMKNVSGKLKLITSMGDISGKNIRISDDCILNSSMGDIDVQLNNPISECKLNLSTSMGKVKMKRADLKTKSRNELKTDSGKFKVNMNTSMGNIIVR